MSNMHFIEPCLPTISPTVPSGSEWAYEIKHEGFRFLAVRQGKRVRIYSRGATTGAPNSRPWWRRCVSPERSNSCRPPLIGWVGPPNDPIRMIGTVALVAMRCRDQLAVNEASASAGGTIMSIESHPQRTPYASLPGSTPDLQQDRLKVLQILGTLINGMEALDHRLKKTRSRPCARRG